jgi:predicted lipid-binding transport protein (Tim44 family)
MKSVSMFVLAAFAATALLQGGQADARRMGGGGNLGAQRSIAPTKPAAPSPSTPTNNASQPTTPTSPAATPAKPVAPPAAAPAPSGMSRWLGPIAGIAAGLGLAALLSHFGLPEGMGSILLIALVIFAGFVLVRMLMARRQQPNAPLQYAGAGASPPPTAAATSSTVPTWRIPSTAELNGGGSSAPSAPDAPEFGVTRKALPQDFDAAAFAREAKRQYLDIQRSYDAADRKALASVMTAEMATEIGRELDGRGLHHPTEIVSLDADVLDVSTEGDKYWVSVRFTGVVREDGEPTSHSIDEVWNLTKPVKGGSGWLLAGISQLA